MTRPTDREPGGADRRSALRLGALAAGAAAGADFLLDAPPAFAQTGANVPNLYPRINAREFQAIRAHENAHVTALQALITSLGGTPRPKPNFQGLASANISAFVSSARLLENVGVGAYNGATPSVFSKDVLRNAAAIALIEARHAGYLNTLLNGIQTAGAIAADQTFEAPLTKETVLSAIAGFVVDLNNGPALTFNATPSTANDIRILNFALALEFLEADFYNVNVPRFFPT